MNSKELSTVIESMKKATIFELDKETVGEAMEQLTKILIWKKVSFNAWSEETEKFLIAEAATITADAWISIAQDERSATESAWKVITRATGTAIMRTVRAERKERASRAAITETTDDEGNAIEIINMIEDQRTLSTETAAIIAADTEIIARDHAEKYSTTPEAMTFYITCRIEGIRPTKAGQQSGMTRRQGINAEETWRGYTHE